MNDNSLRITLGVSACVLGEPVRYDGGHKRSAFVTEALAEHFRLLPVCPEVAIGLGTPRPTLRLVDGGGTVRVRGSRNPGLDVTDALRDFGRRQSEQLQHISGYVFCAKSPSCGLERVPVYAGSGTPRKNGVGIYAEELMRRLPLLPVEDSGRLNDPHLRENFVLRVVAYHRWQQLQREGLTASGLQAFHRRHKFLLLAHNQALYRELGPMLADVSDLQETAERYIALFMQALARPASRGDHGNTLQHMQGFVRDRLDDGERRELTQAIESYRRGLLPLLAPLALFKLFVKRHRLPYLDEQYYLDPYPPELRLRYGL